MNSPVKGMLDDWLLLQDPPRHDDLRSVIGNHLLPDTTAGLAPAIQEICERLVRQVLQQAPAGRHIEFIGEIAYTLPVLVICEILGIETGDTVRFRQWSTALTRALNSGATADLNAAIPAVVQATEYFHNLVEAKRNRPGNDTISRLIGIPGRGYSIPDDVLVNNLIFMIWAGHETTKNLISNGLLTLLHHPEQLARLHGKPELLDDAIEEMLRYESPVQKLSRWNTSEINLGGFRVPAGTQLVCLLGAANRDPAVFYEPDRFDISRAPNTHIAFGRGSHHCLGSRLARLEAKIFFSNVLGLLPRMKIINYQWRTYSAFRSLEFLNVSL
jgi:cytochrome P450